MHEGGGCMKEEVAWLYVRRERLYARANGVTPCVDWVYDHERGCIKSAWRKRSMRVCMCMLCMRLMYVCMSACEESECAWLPGKRVHVHDSEQAMCEHITVSAGTKSAWKHYRSCACDSCMTHGDDVAWQVACACEWFMTTVWSSRSVHHESCIEHTCRVQRMHHRRSIKEVHDE